MNLISIDAGVGKRTAHAVSKDGILTSCANGLPVLNHDWDLVVIERMQWRPGSKENIADLIVVSELVGEYKKLYEMHGIEVELVWPSTWKGGVPKDIHHVRILRKLSEAEVAVIPLRPKLKIPDPNVLDAIGINLWKLGRL